MRSLWVLAVLCAPLRALAADAVSVMVCYNYGCAVEAEIRLPVAGVHSLQWWLRQASSPVEERQRLAVAIGQLYRLAGEQTPIHRDQPGDLHDDDVDGRMDCIDHATTTHRLLQLLAEGDGWRYHRLLPVVRRSRFVFDQHFAAQLEERELTGAGELPAEYNRYGVPQGAELTPQVRQAREQLARRHVLDSWSSPHGAPAEVLPLADWLKGEGPNVY